MSERDLLRQMGYEDELLSAMTDKDCEHELIEIKTGGHM